MQYTTYQMTQPHTKQPIKFSYRFLQTLFAIESDYESRKVYKTRNNGARRLAHHLTKADLQLAVTMQKIVNNDGEVWLTNRHLLYQQVRTFFESPVHKDQFYQAFEKFVFNGLISVLHQDGQTITVKLNHYLEPSGTLGRFIVLPELLFSKDFTALSIAQQKWYLYACGQQGDQHKKVLQQNLDSLYDMLHRQEPGHVKRIISALTEPFAGSNEPLLSIAKLESNVLGYPKMIYQVNNHWLIPYNKGDHGRIAMPIQKSFRRLIARVEGYFSAADSTYSAMFKIKLASLLKGKSERYISYVMGRAVQMGQDLLMSADKVLEQIKLEICDRAAGIRLLIAEQTGVLAYLGKASKKDFVEAFPHKPHVFRRFCKQILPQLQEQCSVPAAFNTACYRKPNEATREVERLVHLETLRSVALAQQLDPVAFMYLTNDAYAYWKQYRCTADELTKWMIAQMDNLPKWVPVPDVSPTFNLIAFVNEQQALLN